jgi:O-antigen/teichoic acid export membrane protein
VNSVVKFLWVAGPKVASGGLQLLTNLLLVQQLGPAGAGVVFVCVTAILLTDAILGSAVDVAVVRRATERSADGHSRSLEVQKAALVAKGLGYLLLAVPFVIWSGPIALLLFGTGEHSALLLLSILSVLGLLVLRSVQTGFQIDGRFKLYGIADLLLSVMRFGGVGVFLAVGAMTPPALLTLYALAPLLLAIVLLVTSARGLLMAPFSRSAVREVMALVKWYLGAAAASSLNTRIDILLVSAVAGTAQAGLFSAAQVCIQPFQLLGMYLAVVFAPRILPLWEAGRLSRIYFRFQKWIVAVSLLVYFAALLGTSTVVAELLPASYEGTAGIVLLLMPSALTALINFPWTVSFLMFTHPRFLFVMEMCACPVLFVLYRWLIGSYGAVGAAVVTSGYALVKTVVYQVLAGWSVRRDFRETTCQGLSVMPREIRGAVG